MIDRCPVCSDLADPDDAIGHSLGSHPISRKSLQQALCTRRWRVQPCGHFTCCPQAATISCEKCNLVRYCSPQCMRKHKESHHKLCSSHLLSKGTTPFHRKRDPKLLPDTPIKRLAHLPTLSNPSFPVYGLLGNADAHYRRFVSRHPLSKELVYTLPSPFSCSELPDHLRFLFPCAFDLRNVLQTICEVPENYTGRVTVFMNSAKSILAVRDVLVLELLRSYGSDGIDIAIALWYSTALTRQQDKTIVQAIHRVLYYGSNHEFQDAEDDLKLGANERCSYKSSFPFSRKGSFMQADLSSDPTGILLGMLRDLNARFEPRTQYWERDEEMDDINSVRRMCALPAHLASWNRYHTCGILLPFDTMDGQFTTPNRVRYCRSLKFMTRYSNDVLCGWDIKKVISSGEESGVSEEDLYGCFFFHIRKMMQTFLQKLTDCCIEICLTQFSAKKLVEILHQAEITFHRVDACSLADDGSTTECMSPPEICTLSEKFSLPKEKPRHKWTLPETLQFFAKTLEKDVSKEFQSRLLTAVLDWATKEPSITDFLQREECLLKSKQEILRIRQDDLHQAQDGQRMDYSVKITPNHNDEILTLVIPFAEAQLLMRSDTINKLHTQHFRPYLRRLATMELMRGCGLEHRFPNVILPRNWAGLMVWRAFLEGTKDPGPDDAQQLISREHPSQLYFTVLFGGLTFLEEFQEWGHRDHSMIAGTSKHTESI